MPPPELLYPAPGGSWIIRAGNTLEDASNDTTCKWQLMVLLNKSSDIALYHREDVCWRKVRSDKLPISVYCLGRVGKVVENLLFQLLVFLVIYLKY